MFVGQTEQEKVDSNTTSTTKQSQKDGTSFSIHLQHVHMQTCKEI